MTKFYKIICILTVIFNVNSVYAKPKIISTITPVTSIISMIAGDEADIITIDSKHGCPHHYELLPSDKLKMEGADIFIFVNTGFEKFANNLLQNYNKQIIDISKIEKINFQNKSGNYNWHFWLNLDGALIFAKELTSILSKDNLISKEIIFSNLHNFKEKINNLKKIKDSKITDKKDFVVLSKSLEHFFDDNENITKIYQNHRTSLKDISKLDSILESKDDQTIVLDTYLDTKKYKKLNKKIITFEPEYWPNGNFYENYKQILEKF